VDSLRDNAVNSQIAIPFMSGCGPPNNMGFFETGTEVTTWKSRWPSPGVAGTA